MYPSIFIYIKFDKNSLTDKQWFIVYYITHIVTHTKSLQVLVPTFMNNEVDERSLRTLK